MWASLHKFEFLQGFVKESNITVQPGPLWLPINERSYASPSSSKMCFRGAIISEREFAKNARWELYEVIPRLCENLR